MMTTPFGSPPPKLPLAQPNVAAAAVPTALFDELAKVIEKRTLMQFGVERRTHFINTVTARTQKIGDPDVASYIRRVLSPLGSTEMMALTDELTINETTFYRNVPQLEMLSRVVLPEIIARKKAVPGGPKRLDLWSAACSTGQEVYTLAIIAYEAVRLLPQWDVRVFGTDISPTVVDTARRGIYPKARLDTVPPGIIQRYFDDQGDKIRVKDNLRRVSIFQQHNLNDSFPQGSFDVIFCRNVMIYFSREDQAKLAQKFKDRLAPQGFLFIGHSETLQGLGVDFKLRIEARGIAYQKP